MFMLQVKSVKTGSVFWSSMAALSYFYMVMYLLYVMSVELPMTCHELFVYTSCIVQVSAWGGYVFIINLIPLHVFVLLLMGRYSSRLFTSYTVFCILGLLLSMQIPFVGFQPIRTSEHMAALGKLSLISLFVTWRRSH